MTQPSTRRKVTEPGNLHIDDELTVSRIECFTNVPHHLRLMRNRREEELVSCAQNRREIAVHVHHKTEKALSDAGPVRAEEIVEENHSSRSDDLRGKPQIVDNMLGGVAAIDADQSKLIGRGKGKEVRGPDAHGVSLQKASSIRTPVALYVAPEGLPNLSPRAGTINVQRLIVEDVERDAKFAVGQSSHEAEKKPAMVDADFKRITAYASVELIVVHDFKCIDSSIAHPPFYEGKGFGSISEKVLSHRRVDLSQVQAVSLSRQSVIASS